MARWLSPRIVIGLISCQPFTRDPEAVADTFAGLKAGETMQAHMLDGLSQLLGVLSGRPGIEAIEHRDHRREQRSSSETNLGDLRARLRTASVNVYALKYSAYWTAFSTKPEEYSPTGGGLLDGIGEVARLGKQNTMELLTEKNLLALATDIHNRYLVSFVPDRASTPSFHPDPSFQEKSRSTSMNSCRRTMSLRRR